MTTTIAHLFTRPRPARANIVGQEIERFAHVLMTPEGKVPFLTLRMIGHDGEFRLSMKNDSGTDQAFDTLAEAAPHIAALSAFTFADTIVATIIGDQTSTVIAWCVYPYEGGGLEVPIVGADLDMHNAATYLCRGALAALDRSLRQFLSAPSMTLSPHADLARLSDFFTIENLRPALHTEVKPS